MLTRLDICFFKCFEKLELPLAPLTLLSGANSSGKSTVLQALALLNQTMREHEWSTRLMLNGNIIKLGVVSDIVDSVHGRKHISIGVQDEFESFFWRFVGERSEMSMTIEEVKQDEKTRANPDQLRYLSLVSGLDPSPLIERLRNLTYITAERVGPREIYDIEDRQAATVVGSRGEHAVSVLNWGRDDITLSGLALDEIPKTLLNQVEGWMHLFFPGCGLQLQQISNANAVTLGMRTSPQTNHLRPIHVGYGLTQVFPIIVAALSAKVGDILLIENPEVHLHPKAQVAMGEFLARVAKSGVQVIAESHSDHVLNGMRRAVKAHILEPAQVALHFFRPRRETQSAQVETPLVDGHGNIDVWPEGFFDQFEKDMTHFAGWDI